jgi:hypothetical protein
LDWGTPNIENHEPEKDTPFDDDTKLGDIFFDKIFPCIKGRDKLMDKYLDDPRAAEHVTYIKEKMQFHGFEAEDPD